MRERICLNGIWNFMPDYDGRSPGEAIRECSWGSRGITVPSSWVWKLMDTPYQPYNIFEYPGEWNRAKAGVLGRQFKVERLGGRRAWLIFNGMLQRSEVYVNGRPVMRSSEGFLPLEADVTDYVTDGENSLQVWCGSYERTETETGSKVVSPPGSWFGCNALGIWQDVFLEYRSATAVQAVHVVPSVRNGSISVKADVHVAKDASGVRADMEILRDGIAVRQLGRGIALIPGDGGNASVNLSQAWPDAELWSPEHPRLYTLRVRLFSAGGAAVDETETRFGFREFWIDGHKYMLNGRRVNLRTDSWHYQGAVQQTRDYAMNWFRACRDMGINSVRLHAMPYPELYLDAADEAGMLVIDESAIYGSGKAMQADDPAFLENCRGHLERLVLRDRNHPSVVIWSMQNEMRWVDGRDGYKQAMRGLVRAMKALDDTRPVSFDGDNRLVDDGDMEIVSMHYNIDGTVAGWDRRKPLAFGEHGKFHYVSPQVGTEFGGQQAYLSFDKCLESIALEEALFSEYARREEVTAIAPFNMANYMMRTQPEHDVRLEWANPEGPGVKPSVIISRSLCINNGLADGPAYAGNPAWEIMHRALKPVAVIADQYNSCFFGGAAVKRTFSVYNDTEMVESARIEYAAELDGRPLISGSREFRQEPGERASLELLVELPQVVSRQRLFLTIRLYHGGAADELRKEYSVWPAEMKTSPVAGNCSAACVGNGPAFERLSSLMPGIRRIEELSEGELAGTDLLVIGNGFSGKAEAIQPALQAFLGRGGFVLALEQESFTPGDLELTGKKFFNTHINCPDHPIFNGVTPEDLQFWGEESAYSPLCRQMVGSAFAKPAAGDMDILLECGEGNFGWGGLLWTPLVEYRVGEGRLLLSQLRLMEFYDDTPQACALLRNMLSYASGAKPVKAARAGLLAGEGSGARRFASSLGLEHGLASPDGLDRFSHMLVDPASLDSASAERLRRYALEGGAVFVLPMGPEHASLASLLCGTPVALAPAELYQLKARSHAATRSVSQHDLYHFEKVTYSPANKANLAVCSHTIEAEGGDTLLESVQNPWYEFFIRGQDAEPVKMAAADIALAEPFKPVRCGVSFHAGKGSVVFCQLHADAGNEKLKRVYARLLANLGFAVRTSLLEHVKSAEDYCLPHVMALAHEPHQSLEAETAYFTSPDYALNNLGEGVYGWMRRVEKKDGRLTVPGSRGKVFFLTVFVLSEINRDPTKRAAGELPDSSIVPDLVLSANCRTEVYVNGGKVAETGAGGSKGTTVKDVLLSKGLNRMAFVCEGGAEDIALSASFQGKYGECPEGLNCLLTMD